jgi:hypothetical protein
MSAFVMSNSTHHQPSQNKTRPQQPQTQVHLHPAQVSTEHNQAHARQPAQDSCLSCWAQHYEQHSTAQRLLDSTSLAEQAGLFLPQATTFARAAGCLHSVQP